MECPYCQSQIEISKLDATIEELDFEVFAEQANKSGKITITAVECSGCGATFTFEPHIQTAHCPYCDTSLLLQDVHPENIIQPNHYFHLK